MTRNPSAKIKCPKCGEQKKISLDRLASLKGDKLKEYICKACKRKEFLQKHYPAIQGLIKNGTLIVPKAWKTTIKELEEGSLKNQRTKK